MTKYRSQVGGKEPAGTGDWIEDQVGKAYEIGVAHGMSKRSNEGWGEIASRIKSLVFKYREALELASQLNTSQDALDENHTVVLAAMDALNYLPVASDSVVASSEFIADVLERLHNRVNYVKVYSDARAKFDDWQELLDAGYKALQLVKASPWIATKDRSPTKEDADKEGCVLAYLVRGDAIAQLADWNRVRSNTEYFPYWMPIPELPKQQ